MTVRSLIFMYRPAFARTVIYMLQSVEYQPINYLRWFWRASDFSRVTYRKSLVMTRPARLLLTTFRWGALAEIVGAIWLGVHGISSGIDWQTALSVGLLLFTPVAWGHMIVLPLLLGRLFIMRPLQSRKIKRSEGIFTRHPAVKIAVAGSYGKTTVKEILLTVLAEGKKVKATPANKNVAISHALFAHGLAGDEDIIILEYGEGAPGDVPEFARNTKPDIGIITGLAPAHLDRYKTLDRAAQDIFSLADFVGELYVNGDSAETKPFVKPGNAIFSHKGVADWKVSEVKVSLEGLSFKMTKPGRSYHIKSRLLGEHLIGPLALAVFLADKFGLSFRQIQAGIAKVEPFEHRMKPYQLSGAWVIDDTYNGNIDGMKAGLKLLAQLPAKRKIYITPGLVDQGADAAKIHQELGQVIAAAAPDVVILMKHSVTSDIIKGLSRFRGKLIVEDDPLDFYSHLDKFVAAGDVVLMQNDWPDNYN